MAALHVVHLIEALGPGGAERLLYTNLKHFDPARIQSTVFTVNSDATHWLEPIRKLGVQVISIDCSGSRSLPTGIRKVFRWLRANPTDVIHSHLWAANVVGRVAGRLAGVPVISSVHNPDHEQTAWSDGADVSLTKRRIVKAIDGWTARVGNERLIAVSEYVRQSAHRHLHFPSEKIELLYNPIDIQSVFPTVEKSRGELLRECGLPEDAIVLLHIGRVSPQKGLIYAVRALPRVIASFPATHLLSVGALSDPAWRDELRREAERVGVVDRFHMLGARRDVAALLRLCDVFVFPSLYEGLGIALIEAMAAGCACVAANVGPIPEFMQHNEDGLLVESANSEALARAICDLLADPKKRQELSANAKRNALSRFQPQPAADRLTEIYEQVARGNSAGK